MCFALRALVFAAAIGIGVAHAQSSMDKGSPQKPVTIMKVLPAGEASPASPRDPNPSLSGGTTGEAPKPVKTIKVAPTGDATHEDLQRR